MRWLVLMAIAALAAVVVWSRTASDEPAKPVAAPVAIVEGRPSSDTDVTASAAVQSHLELDAGELDAGVATPIDVTVEILEANRELRAIGADITFWSEDGSYVTSSRTNVMGFTQVALPPGVYVVGPAFDQRHVRVDAQANQLTLRMVKAPEPHLVYGVVVDETGKPAGGAEVLIEEDLGGGISRRARGKRFGAERSATLEDGGVRHRSIWLSREAITDNQGRFAFTTFKDELRLKAELGRRRSLWVDTAVPGRDVKLRLTVGIAEVTFRFDGVDTNVAFAQFEQSDDVREESVTSGEQTEQAPGRLVARMRTLDHGRLFSGHLDLELAPNSHTTVTMAFVPAPALRVRVVNEWKDTVAGAEINAHGCDQLTARSGLDGTFDLVPPVLCSFAPLYQIELGGIWRNLRPVQARIGDEPAEVIARPFNAALDSTDASTPVPWGGDR